MLDALELDDVDEEDDEAENTEAHCQRYAGILQHVHAFVSIDACTRASHTNNR